jgi:transcriptional regulator with XRE-family HTH domain
MEQTAQAAGIHRSTLHRWEKGEAQPRLTELTALLTVLDASMQQKRTALHLMDTPRAVRQLRQEVTQIAKQGGMAPLPHGGDLLHAMRMRQGLALDEVARCVQVTGGTLRRWEKMEVWPSLEQLHQLCYALDAQEEEIFALTVGQFTQRPQTQKVAIETLQERLRNIRRLEAQVPAGYPLFELTYLQLEADAWPLALRSAAGKQMLISIYAFHAQSLSFRERLAEAGPVAGRALELMTDGLKLQRDWLYPVIVSARSIVYRGERPAPKQGLERLRAWLSEARWAEMQAWIWSDMAKYIGLSGEQETALTLVDQACRLMESGGDEVELRLRKWDKASLLLQAGRPGAALSIVVEKEALPGDPRESLDVSLLRAQTYLELGDLTTAHNWLQSALTTLETYHLEYKRPHAETLAVRMQLWER